MCRSGAGVLCRETVDNMPVLQMKTKITTPLWRECRDFYCGLLGLKVLEQWDLDGDRGVILGFGAPPHTACLELYGATAAASVCGAELQFKVENLQDFLDSVPDYFSFDGPTARPWGAVYAYFTDPAGTAVVVFEAA